MLGDDIPDAKSASRLWRIGAYSHIIIPRSASFLISSSEVRSSFFVKSTFFLINRQARYVIDKTVLCLIEFDWKSYCNFLRLALKAISQHAKHARVAINNKISSLSARFVKLYLIANPYWWLFVSLKSSSICILFSYKAITWLICSSVSTGNEVDSSHGSKALLAARLDALLFVRFPLRFLCFRPFFSSFLINTKLQLIALDFASVTALMACGLLVAISYKDVV